MPMVPVSFLEFNSNVAIQVTKSLPYHNTLYRLIDFLFDSKAYLLY